jgi:hypothetical protein
MINKKLIYLITIIFVALIFVGLAFRVYEYLSWKPIIENNNKFIEVWGTYDYKNFDNYPDRVKGFLSEEAFNKYLGDPQSLEIRKGRMITKSYSVENRQNKVISKKKTGDIITIKTEVEEKVISNEESYEKNKIIEVVWDYSDSSKPLVVDIRYNP